MVLGILLADPNKQIPREDRSWRWAQHTTPATRRWAQHILTADHREESLVYEHEGELVLVYASVPARAHELDCWNWALPPRWRPGAAPATAETRTLATRLAQQRSTPRSSVSPRRRSWTSTSSIMRMPSSTHGYAGRRSWTRAC